MAANWWTQPMPAGWEAKWDPGQLRYFFIDHTTRMTSWTDPRSIQTQPSPAPQRSTTIPMEELKCVKCQKDLTSKQKKSGYMCWKCKNQSTEHRRAAPAAAAAAPTVEETTFTETLSASQQRTKSKTQYEEGQAREKLVELGFDSNQQESQQEDHFAEQFRHNQLKERFYEDFPSLSHGIIDETLETFVYSEDESRAVLESMISEEKRRKQAAEIKAAEREAAEREAAERKAAEKTAAKKTSLKKDSPKKKQATPKKTTFKLSPSQTQQPEAGPSQQVTRAQEPRVRQGRGQQADYKFASKLAKGPDLSLCHGPSGINSFTSVLAKGHDPSLCHGPAKKTSRIKSGYCQAKGADPALRAGPLYSSRLGMPYVTAL